jgi:hypothetical protein
MVATMDEEKRYRSEEQQGPLGKTAARDCYLTAVANCTLDISLINDINAGLRISRDGHTSQQRVR